MLHGISLYRHIFKRLSIVSIFRIGILLCKVFYVKP